MLLLILKPAIDKRSARESNSRPESERSELSTSEVMRRMREKSEREKKKQDFVQINAMGPYNAFSRPKSSTVCLSFDRFLWRLLNFYVIFRLLLFEVSSWILRLIIFREVELELN
jgi:hypothetical protein